MRFVDQFQALLFDMNGTFMFEHDRLGYEEDFFATYRRLGGTRLTAEVVRGSVLRTCSQLRRDYDDPACFESFPTLVDAVVSYGEVTAADAKDIANVIAEHEVGVVPRWAATALQCLSSTHSLALVSNVWSPEGHWIDELVRSDVARAFRHQVFSSSVGAIKPSPRLFLAALDALNVESSSALFIGDSVERDIRPAKQLGLGTVLISSSEGCLEADLVLPSIAQLLHHSDG